MKKLIFTSILVIFVVSTTFAQYSKDRIGFAGLSISGGADKSVGLGAELSTIKKKTGIGFNVDVTSSYNLDSLNTLSNFFLMWRITDEYFLNTGISGMYSETSGFKFGGVLGASFVVSDPFYTGFHINLDNKGIRNFTLTFGYKFD